MIPLLLLSTIFFTTANASLTRVPLRRSLDLDHEAGKDPKFSNYYGLVRIGKNGPAKEDGTTGLGGSQEFRVLFDTGSGNIIIPSTECEDTSCVAHKRYDVDESESGKAVPIIGEDILASAGVGASGNPQDETLEERDLVSIQFGTGEITGACYKDEVCLGSTDTGGDTNVVCSNTHFLATTAQSDVPFSALPYDGVFGLGLPRLSETKDFNYVDNLVGQKRLGDKNLFSIYLDPAGRNSFKRLPEGANATDFPADNSQIILGGYDRDLMQSDILWAPVSDPAYWQVEVTDLTINNAGLNIWGDDDGDDGGNVAVDTGTNLLAGPAYVVSQLVERLNVLEDCSNFNELPLLGFAVGDHILNLHPSDYVKVSPRTGCTVNIMSLQIPPQGGPLFLLGEPFLRRFYAIFDRTNLRVGFAVSKQGEEDGTAPDADFVAGLREKGFKSKPVRPKRVRKGSLPKAGS